MAMAAGAPTSVFTCRARRYTLRRPSGVAHEGRPERHHAGKVHSGQRRPPAREKKADRTQKAGRPGIGSLRISLRKLTPLERILPQWPASRRNVSREPTWGAGRRMRLAVVGLFGASGSFRPRKKQLIPG